jgi:sortase A
VTAGVVERSGSAATGRGEPAASVKGPAPRSLGAGSSDPQLAPWYIPSTALVILACLLFTFLITITGFGGVRHARDQATAFATLRAELANSVAPVSQLGEDGKPLALGRPMAILDIPQVGIREVVFEGTTSGVLRSGPGHRRDTPFPGQAGTSILFGRKAAFGGPFAHLDQLTKGQVFTVTTGQGRIVYRILGARRAGDPQPAAPAAGKGRLILMTATGDKYVPSGLLRVDADQVSDVLPGGARPITAQTLPAPETAMQGDPSVWVSILLLSQGLLLVALLVAWARARWGRAQVWLTGMPVLLGFGVALSSQAACLLPNLM